MTAAVAVVAVKEGVEEASYVDRKDATVLPSASVVAIVVAVVGLPGAVVVVGDQANSTFSIEDMGRSLGGSTALATASATMVAPSLLLAVVRAAALRLP